MRLLNAEEFYAKLFSAPITGAWIRRHVYIAEKHKEAHSLMAIAHDIVGDKVMFDHHNLMSDRFADIAKNLSQRG